MENPGNVVPDDSAEHAPGARSPWFHWDSGPATPRVALMSERPDYAPAYYISRVEYGSFGSFSLEELTVLAGCRR